MQKQLLNLACRHHIFEIFLQVAFQECLNDVSTGLEITLFQKFRENWINIDQNRYKTVLKDNKINHLISDKRDEILKFIDDTLKYEKQPRGDYKKFLLQTKIFSGETSNVRFSIPGASHR